jgi:hypothetical protein
MPITLGAIIRVGVIAFAFTLCTHLPMSPQVKSRGVAEVYRDLSELIHGQPVSVVSSPELCSSGATSPPVDSAPQLIDWYFGQGRCELLYPPRPTSLVSPLAERQSKVVFRSAESRAKLFAILDELIQAVEGNQLSAQEKLIIHTTAWELAFSLDWFGLHDLEMERVLEPGVRRAVRLLRTTQFSPDELALLPATLKDLSQISSTPEIASDVESLLNHDSGIAEVVLPTELHADLHFGRFTPRVFLTLTRGADRAAFRRYVTQKETRYEDLRNLPLKFAGIKGILVLYFNVLTADLKIIPTDQVAFWYEYTFSDKTAFELPFNEAANRIQFISIAYVNKLGHRSALDTARPVYKQSDSKEMTRAGILDVKPVNPGERVNSRRAQCLRCHLNQIAAFDTHGPRRVAFSDPLTRSARDLLTPYFKNSIESKLGQWNQKYPLGQK